MNRIFVLLLLLGTGLAQAEPLTWYLQDVSFADGGSASGSFVYDADSNVYSNVAVTTTASDALAATVYGYGMLNAEFTPSAMSVNLSVAAQPVIKTNELMLAFVTALTNAGGQVALATKGSLSKEGLCVEVPLHPEQNNSCDAGGFVNWLRTVTQGFVTSAPVSN